MSTGPPGQGFVGRHTPQMRRAVLSEPEPTRLAETIEAARAAFQAGRFDDARVALEHELGRRASPTESTDGLLERGRASTLLAIVQLTSTQPDDAARSASSALDFFDQVAASSYGIPERCFGDHGIALQIAGRNQPAIEILTEAADNPMVSTPDVSRHLGLAYAATGEWKEAEHWLGLTINSLPGDLVARRARAGVLEEQKQSASAAREYADAARAALEVQPALAVEFADAAFALDGNLENLILKGDALRLNDQLDEAFSVTDEALKEDRKSASALALRGRVLYAQGEHEDAIEYLGKAVALDKTRLYAWSELAYAQREAGRLDKAKAASDQALRLAENFDVSYLPWVLFPRALILLDLGELDDAVETADRLIHFDGVEPRFKAVGYVVKGRAFASQGQIGDAVAALYNAARLEPEFGYLYFDIADLEHERGREDMAHTALEEAVQHYPERRGEALARMGAGLIRQGKAGEARSKIEQALVEDPDSALAVSRLAEVLRQEGEYEQALDNIERGIKLGSTSAETIGTKGQILSSLGRQEEAIAALNEAVELKEDLAWAHAELGEILRVRGSAEEALPHIKRAIELAGEDSTAWVYGSLGAALQQIGEYDEALKALDAALVMDPFYGWGMGVKGTVFLDIGEVSRGLEELKRAVAALPDALWVRQELGFALLQSGDAAAAEGVFRRAQELEPGNLMLAKGRASALEELDRLAEAVYVLSEARSAALAEGRTSDATDLLADVGYIHLLDGRFPLALEATVKALEEDPDHVAALSQAGEFLRRVAEFDSATVVLKRVPEEAMGPGHFYRLGQVYERLRDWKTARGWYERQMQSSAASLEGRRGLGESLLHLGEEEAAVEKFKAVTKAVDRVTSTKLRVLTAGWCHYRLGNLGRAVRYFTEVVDRDAQQMQSQMALGLLLFANNRIGPSIRQYLQAVSTLLALKNPMQQRGTLVRAVQDFDDYLTETDELAAIPESDQPLPTDAGADAATKALTELMMSVDLDRVTVAVRVRRFLAANLDDVETVYQKDWRPRVEPLLTAGSEPTD